MAGSDLRGTLEAFEASAQGVLVVTGAGGDFCAGADLDPSRMDRLQSVENRHLRMKEVGTAAMALHRLTKPAIAAVDGVAVGAGMNLALGCDVVVATERARFSEIFVKRGLTVDFGGSWLLPGSSACRGQRSWRCRGESWRPMRLFGSG